MTQRKSIVVYGPQGCGKTSNAKKIARHFGLRYILDDFGFGQQLPRFDTLILTNCGPDDVTGMHRPEFIRFGDLPKELRS